MKYLSEYRDPMLVEDFLNEIHKITNQPWTLMEICGGQTHSLVKNGIPALLPDKITLVHGPGCPVCVTSIGIIDEAIFLAQQPDVILCSFGDMLRVPGSQKSLLEVKAQGADVRIMYSPLEAVKLAEENPNKQVVFFAVGFETTAP
ncbi:MAG: hydrogenase formation protein HypD, partial [Saprospiraceae bacterium]|nr:hydrogenase formation protein HypD [Saprospiraceae bacterium]